MKYLFLKNLKKFNLLRLEHMLKLNNLSFFLFYVNYDEIVLYRKFIELNKSVFKIFFNFAFKKIKLIDYWNIWGNDYYVCFFFSNDIYLQLDFILKNKFFVDDYIYNGTFVNVDLLNEDTIFFEEDIYIYIDIKFYFILLYIYNNINMLFNKFIYLFENFKI